MLNIEELGKKEITVTMTLNEAAAVMSMAAAAAGHNGAGKFGEVLQSVGYKIMLASIRADVAAAVKWPDIIEPEGEVDRDA